MGTLRRRLLPLTLAALLAVTTSACMGKFAAVRWVYDFNNSITDSKVVHTLVLYAFLILPVYELAAAADFFVLNVIEFWTGDNLLGDLQPAPDGGLNIARGDQHFSLRPLDATHVAFYQGAALLGVSELQADGAVVVRDAQQRDLRTISTDEVAQVRALLPRLAAAE